jgi:two-component system chemotaxis response regulator CheB
MSKRDIVVIGTSAGGLDALTSLLRDLPATLSASLFIVMHTRARSPTLLQEILQRHTSLKIITPIDKEKIRHGHVYVAPPNLHMTITSDNHVVLTNGPRVNHCRPAIDPLFRSVALCCGPRAIGAILTGMLDDGVEGLRLIKNQGGIALVQSPKDAQYTDMPSNVLAKVPVDYCVPLAEVAPLITQIVGVTVKKKTKSAPRQIQNESKINVQKITSTKDLNHLGKLSSFTCPECQGTLWELDHDKVLRYRCRIGHIFGPQTLLEIHDESLENILWSAVRALEENAEISQRVANYVNKQNVHAKSLFTHKAKTAEQNATQLKGMLLKIKSKKK